MLALLTPAHAHPVHTSLAEADYNRETGCLEFAVRVFADDIEDALSAAEGRRISFEKTAAREVDAVLRRYLTARFTVRAGDSAPLPLRWIGRDLKDAANELWLFFEVALPSGLDSVRLRHGLLAERFSDQLNSIRVRDGGRSATLLYYPDRGEKLIPPLR